MKSFLILSLAALLALAGPALAQTTWYVDVNGDDLLGSGTLAAPWATIQHGIDNAATGDTLSLFDGTFTGAGNRDLHTDGKGLVLRSDGGDPAACMVDAENDASGTGWVFYDHAAGAPVTIEGITVANGATGGIDLRAARAVRNCRITNTGTGLMIPDDPAFVVEGTEFTECITGLDNTSFSIDFTADSCTFSGCNHGVDEGPAGDVSQYTNCTFTMNSVGVAGSLSHSQFEDCVFQDNDYGVNAEIWAYFTRCLFTGHTTAAVRLYMTDGWAQFDSCAVADNPGAGVVAEGDFAPRFFDTFVGGNGGTGISGTFFNGPFQVTRCVVVNNGGAGLDVTWGQVPFTDGSVVVENSTVAGNALGLSAPDVEDLQVRDTIVAFNTGEGLYDTGAVYERCDVYGNGADALPDSWAAGTAGNLAKDPLFCDAAGGDYSLAVNSPCAPSSLQDLIGALDVACEGVPEPVLLSVADVPADQGGQVRVTWYRSGEDRAGAAVPVTGYDLYRRVDAAAAAARRDRAEKLLGWDFVMHVPARGDQGYQAVAPTVCDSTIVAGDCPSVFLVSAVTADPYTFWDSAPDSGASVDNLAPGVPLEFAVSYAAAGNLVSWTPPGDEDVDHYEIWRTDGTPPPPDPGTPATTETATHWVDDAFTGDAWDWVYWAAAVDVSGNRGPMTVWATAFISGTGDGDVIKAVALLGNAPNPFNPATTIRFALPRTAAVDLAVYDVAGRRVRRLVTGEVYPAGRHATGWDGTDEAGRSVAAGTYIVRLLAAGETKTGRVMLLK